MFTKNGPNMTGACDHYFCGLSVFVKNVKFLPHENLGYTVWQRKRACDSLQMPEISRKLKF